MCLGIYSIRVQVWKASSLAQIVYTLLTFLFYHCLIHAAMEPGGGSGGDWVATDIEVKIRETHDDHNLIMQRGIVRSISVSLTSHPTPSQGH